jgi:uncharacterized protein
MGRAEMLKTLRPELFANEKFGVITVKDILGELEKPGRDPRPDFKVARFNDGVDDIKDLKEGMILEGTVSNVAQFGAFIDLGVHQDGLVHVSQLPQVRQRRARGRQDRRHRQGQGAGGRRGAQAHQPVDEARCGARPPRRPARQPLRGRGPRPAAARRDNSPQPAGQMASAFAKLQGLRK